MRIIEEAKAAKQTINQKIETTLIRISDISPGWR
jgi:hypothetical protein